MKERRATSVKFKVGDKVRVTSRMCGHRFKIGEIVTITEVCSSNYQALGEDGFFWYLEDQELSKIWIPKFGEKVLCWDGNPDEDTSYALTRRYLGVDALGRHLVVCFEISGPHEYFLEVYTFENVAEIKTVKEYTPEEILDKIPHESIVEAIGHEFKLINNG